jgi:tetratricopeptide (TPR) repeat protein
MFWAGPPRPAQAQVSLDARFVPRKEAKETAAPDPAHLNDIVRVKADADSSAGIARVAFEVDDQFRAEVKMPPFVYDWDTLEENDGQHSLAVTAYNINGQTKVMRFKVTVENRLNLGVRYYAEQAMQAFRQGDGIGVDRAARRAYKINRGDPEAARAMALDVGIKGDVSRAFQILDDQQVRIPKDDPVTEEVRGYLLIVRAASAPGVAAMLPDLQAGYDLFRKTVVAYRAAARAAYPEDRSDAAGHLACGDRLFLTNDAEGAASAYERAVSAAAAPEQRRRARLRLGMAMLRQGRLQEAEDLARALVRSNGDDATAAALLGAAQFQRRQYAAAQQTVAAGMRARNIAALIVAALTDLALGRRADAYREARDLVTLWDSAETQYVAQAALADAGDQAGSRKSFQLAFTRAPLFLPILIGRAYDTMAYDKADDRFIQAGNLFDILLRVEPDNPAAQAGRAAALIQLKHPNAAQAMLTKLQNTDPTAPDQYVLKAAILSGSAAQAPQARAALNFANRLDPVNYRDTYAPPMTDFVVRMARLRRSIPLTPMLLDRADAPPAPADADAKTAPSAGPDAPPASTGK